MVDAARPRALAILTRAPSAGGKSRLFRALGSPPDPALLTALLLDTLEAAAIPGVHRRIVVTPASARDDVRSLVGEDVQVEPQGEGDLGARMREAMASMFTSGAGIAVLIGSDLPHLPRRHVEAAFAHLTVYPDALVLGPAVDGGYYLVAATSLPPIFDGPRWGTGSVLADTRRLALDAGLPVQLLDPLADVDDLATLRAAVEGDGTAPRTRAWWNGWRAGNKDVTMEGL